jgi:signal transduction histidine kinase
LTEINFKYDIKSKVEALKEEINQENTLTVEAVTEMARQQEVERLKRIVDTNLQLSKHIDHYGNVLSNV